MIRSLEQPNAPSSSLDSLHPSQELPSSFHLSTELPSSLSPLDAGTVSFLKLLVPHSLKSLSLLRVSLEPPSSILLNL